MTHSCILQGLHTFFHELHEEKRFEKRILSTGSKVDPHPPSLRQRAAAFSAAAWRVAAPTALTEHGWLAKLSSHTTWRGWGGACATCKCRLCTVKISKVTWTQTRRGARLCSFDGNRGPHNGLPGVITGKIQRWQRVLWLD